jgi:hypothetical protein
MARLSIVNADPTEAVFPIEVAAPIDKSIAYKLDTPETRK